MCLLVPPGDEAHASLLRALWLCCMTMLGEQGGPRRTALAALVQFAPLFTSKEGEAMGLVADSNFWSLMRTCLVSRLLAST